MKNNFNFITSPITVSNHLLKYFLGLGFLFFSLNIATAQKVNLVQKAPKKPNTKEFVISYGITVDGVKKKGLEQTYNGGLKTVFVKNDLVRIRLVSLMRMQSLYFNNKKWIKTNVASMVKESGKDKSILSFTTKEWQQFNSKNDSIHCDIYVDDTLTILDKLCNKAILTFKDSTKLTVYYLPGAKSKTLTAAEPIFNTVPGLVMKYNYEIKNKSVTYTAVDFKFAPLSNTIFITPKVGYIKLKFNATGNNTAVSEDEDEDIEGAGDEDDNTIPTKTPAPVPAPTKSGSGK